MTSPSQSYVDTLTIHGQEYRYFSLKQACDEYSAELQLFPYSLRILLEGALRSQALKHGSGRDVDRIMRWEPISQYPRTSIEYQPGRVLLQDLTGVPVVVDLASLRAAAARSGKNPQSIHPRIPVDLVVDHSLQVDVSGTPFALQANQELEYQRNGERYELLKWAQSSFRNMRIVPPGTGIVHQINLEYLGQVVLSRETEQGTFLFPDTVIGTDSHTTMINGLGILGWGVGGIEAIAAMLDQPIETLLPDVVGVRLSGQLPAGTMPTDIVLTLTQLLRKMEVVDQVVEFYGEGLDYLSVEDRAMIANMAPEYGATAAYFPVDAQTLRYLAQTKRSEELIRRVEEYTRVQNLYRLPDSPLPRYSRFMELDLSQLGPVVAGPKRPQDVIFLSDVKSTFQQALEAPVMEQGYALPAAALSRSAEIRINGEAFRLRHGSIVLAAITSCTNTSNPTAMVAAGLLAKKAVEAGLKVPAYVKTSFAPGSRVVSAYLQQAGLQAYLDKLGFQIVGYGCTTCIGNSGPLLPEVGAALESTPLVAAAVLSGNRNFEGRVHPQVQASFLASPALVVAYALAGSMNQNLATDPLGIGKDGQSITLQDLWPSAAEIQTAIESMLSPELFATKYAEVFAGDERWQAIRTSAGGLYSWDPHSTYLRETTFCNPVAPLQTSEIKVRVLAIFGDSITTDHISPAGAIQKDSPAAAYLRDHGVDEKDFNTYGSRRGNHEVMMRGTFANIRLKNRMVPDLEGNRTLWMPDREPMTIFDAAQRYQADGIPLVILAGKEYGTGSSRDWAAKGPQLLGVQAIIAESFERIHRSNLAGMGILPLQFTDSASVASLGLTGEETLTLRGLDRLEPGGTLSVFTEGGHQKREFYVKVLLNSDYELKCIRSRGVFHLFMDHLS